MRGHNIGWNIMSDWRPSLIRQHEGRWPNINSKQRVVLLRFCAWNVCWDLTEIWCRLSQTKFSGRCNVNSYDYWLANFQPKHYEGTCLSEHYSKVCSLGSIGKKGSISPSKYLASSSTHCFSVRISRCVDSVIQMNIHFALTLLFMPQGMNNDVHCIFMFY